jgi:mono/diheme cytochrome c family protein
MELEMTKKSMGLSKAILLSSMSLLLMLPFQNCGSRHDSELALSSADQALIFYQGEVQKVFQAKCASCHQVGNETELQNILDFDELISKGFVVPGRPEISPVYLLVVDDIEPRANHSKLTIAEKDIVAAWIIALYDPSGAGGTIGGGGGGANNTYMRVRNEVLVPYCISCHGATGAAGGIRLDTYQTVMTQVNRNAPASSPVYSQMLFDFMPTGPNKVPLQLKNLVLNWIVDGAQNN